MIIKKKRYLSIILISILLSCSTTCFAKELNSLEGMESIVEETIEPRMVIWASIKTTSGVIPIPAGTYVPGASSYYIKLLQATLNKLGYNCGTADGIFGNNTRNAIITFQTNNGLSVDGIAGEYTWKNLAFLISENNYTVTF